MRELFQNVFADDPWQVSQEHTCETGHETVQMACSNEDMCSFRQAICRDCQINWVNDERVKTAPNDFYYYGGE